MTSNNAACYYTLAVFEDGKWVAEFGDYQKRNVQDEQTDYQWNAETKGIKPRTKILLTRDDQDSINAAIAALN